MASTPVFEGGCFCGNVRYQATGYPEHRVVCHCESCRHTAGSPAAAWVTFPISNLEYTQGKPSSFESSPKVTRTFCASCGTPLTYQNGAGPDSIDVTTCSFDTPDSFPPTHHSWLQDTLSWFRAGDDLPAFQRTRSEG